ncbi:MAG TPA: hypothetical protein VLV17_00205 [Anaeromyxobacteraceae bacterium]|nr:hypothetical protein [Anaeromyxobacteraceae bacterium]
MTRPVRLILLTAALCVAGATRADTVNASSTTILLGRQDWRDGSLQTAVPLYEIIRLDASDVATPIGNLEIALSSWGAADLGDIRFWQNGGNTNDHFTGDVDVGFVRGIFLDRALTLTLGRQTVIDGLLPVQIDGGSARLALPYGFALSGYAGAPVAPRFMARGGDLVTQTVRATFASGGRVSWNYPGLLEAGASVAVADDRAAPSRRDVGADIRVTPIRYLQLLASGWLSLYEQRLGESVVSATFYPVRHLDFTLDYRHVEPDLFLPRDSILSVFVADKRNDVGGALHWGPQKGFALDGDYHVLLQDQGTGHWARAKATLHPGGQTSTVGTELSYLKSNGVSEINDNGYEEVRLFGARELMPALTGTLDLMAYFFNQDVNGEPRSLAATATLAYGFARGWRAALAGTAGSTPFMERQFEIMGKLVYEQTYATREVK